MVYKSFTDSRWRFIEKISNHFQKAPKGRLLGKKNGSLFEFCIGGGSIKSHTLAERFGRHQKNEPHINYESRAIMSYKIPNFDGKNRAILRKPIFDSFYTINWPFFAIQKVILGILYHIFALLSWFICGFASSFF